MYQAYPQAYAGLRLRSKAVPRPNLVMLAVLAALGNATVAHAAPSPAPASPPSPGPAPSAGAAQVEAAAAAAAAVAPPEVQFSSSFLGGGSNSYNLESYEKGNPILPGDYRVDVFVNGFGVGRETVSFLSQEGSHQARPCITPELSALMGVDMDKLKAATPDLAGCLDLPLLIPAAKVDYDPSLLRLEVSLPQVSMSHRPRDYVDPSLWDRGINAFTLGYTFNAYHMESRGARKHNSAYLGLNAGLNLGAWRIRSQSNLQWSESTGSHYQNVSTYAQRDIIRLKSQLTLGDTFTSGKFFDATPFRGVQLATDERMRPDSVNGYAPIVRGTAETNAKVEIRQLGYVIYETTVAPGPFEITDLYPNGMGGDLEVTITEADMRKKTYKVPYSSVPQLLRPGVWNYSATFGKVRNDSLIGKSPNFVEATYQRGINNWLTAYAGLQATDRGLYNSGIFGSAINTSLGAVALDISTSRTRLERSGRSRNGFSARVTYNKNIPSTRTDFALAAYRYSSRGYLSLADAAQMNDWDLHDVRDHQSEFRRHQRSRFQVTVSQRFSDNGGSLFVSGSRSAYWNDEAPVDLTLQAGWSSRLGQGHYSITANRSRLLNGSFDNNIYVNYSIPLGRAARQHAAPQLTVGVNQGSAGSGAQVGVTGSQGSRSQFSYGVQGNYNGRGSSSVNANAAWRAAYSNLSSNLSYASGSQGISVGANGGLVIHGGGITFTPQLGDTMALVHADGAKGARLASDNISKVDGRGYVVTTNLMPYRMNEINLDPKGSSLSVELESTRRQVAPRAGAVVAVEFATKRGKPMLMRASLEDGNVVPFGAQVTDDHGNQLGLVGQGGQVMLRGADRATGDLIVEWGGGDKCTISRDAAASGTSDADLEVVSAVCRSYSRM